MRSFLFLLFWTVLAVSEIRAAAPSEWRSKSIYQVLTDRFARTDGSTSATCNTGDRVYCGGTYRGLINKLDYIQGMGFTAVWISPIVTNLNGITAYGEAYHGYWAQDITTLNSHFGTATDLKDLASALHNRGMYLMVDVVPNHFGAIGPHQNVDYSMFKPFSSKSYFDAFCWITNYDNQTEVEECWLGDDNVVLVDVDTNQEVVRSTYNKWIRDLISTYSIDGLRIDTAKHMEKAFLTNFNDAAGIYSVGEVFDGDTSYTCGYQGSLDGVLNYPLYYPLINAFQSTSGSISALTSAISDIKDDCPDSTLLGTFSENHDNARFASKSQDLSLAKNVATVTILHDGIPIIYAGQEQHYSGGDDPSNREATWLSGYSTTSPLYTHIAKLNQIRNKAINDLADDYLTYKSIVLYSSANALALRKARVITIVNNMGEQGGDNTFTLEDTGFSEGEEVVEVLTCGSATAGNGGNLGVRLSKGLPQAWYPAGMLAGSGICGR